MSEILTLPDNYKHWVPVKSVVCDDGSSFQVENQVYINTKTNKLAMLYASTKRQKVMK